MKSLRGVLMLVAVALVAAAQGRSDTVYIWSTDGSITKIASNGVSSVIGNLSGWNGPVGLTVDIGGNLVTGSPSDSTIRRFPGNGSPQNIGQVDSVSALAYDHTAVLYASSPNYTEICRPDYIAGFGYYCCQSTNYTQSQLSYPTSIAIDSSGVLFVANNVNPFSHDTNPPANTIAKFSKDFEFLGVFASGLNQPWGLAFDYSGNLFVSTFGDHRIYKFTPGGVKTTFATITSGLKGPQGLAFDSEGYLYVANSVSNNILKYSPGGVVSVFASGLVSPCAVAIQPGLSRWSLPTVTLEASKVQPGELFRLAFTNSPDLRFKVLAATNANEPFTNWATVGAASEIFSGYYYFDDFQMTNTPQRFFRIQLP